MMNKTYIVLGASRGIGRACVDVLRKDSNNIVIAISRNIEPLKDLSSSSNVFSYALDISSDQVRPKLEEILAKHDSIDALINNAGLLVNKAFLELTFEDISSSYLTNIVGIMAATQAVVPKMETTGGHIVNISSIGGFQGSVKFPGLAAYSTSKAALSSFTELFAEEYKDTKIKMNCLCLGAVQTEMLAQAFPGYDAPLSAEQMADYICQFTQEGHRYFNGKIIPVSLSTP